MTRITQALSKWTVFGLILVSALGAFEAFNYDTTRYAFDTILEGSFWGFSRSAILAIAFCGMDFAGLSRIFTPETNFKKEPKEVRYLFGAWLVAAMLNGLLTWWAVSVMIINSDAGNAVLNQEQLLTYAAPVVAVGVFLTRVLIIGTISSAGDHLFNANPSSKSSKSSRTQTNKRKPARKPLSPVKLTKIDPSQRRRPAPPEPLPWEA